ncbi:MAG TPA: AAA family ATPase [Gemmataceae bacterium]|nr:AAA family ATPase [Gemmataceae bacterium]
MKIAKVVIENFRHIEKLELDFTDSLGRVRDLILLVGPNGCGKTSVLDAIALALGPVTGITATRPDLTLSPRSIVRQSASFAQVSCEVRFGADEVAATHEALQSIPPQPGLGKDLRWLQELSLAHRARDATAVWRYPDPKKESAFGRTECSPDNHDLLFGGKAWYTHYRRNGPANQQMFRRVGGVYTFDQQRTGAGMSIPADIRALIQKFTAVNGAPGPQAPEEWAKNPRNILLSLALQALIPAAGVDAPDVFKQVKDLYARICTPHQIVGPIRDESGVLDVVFSNGKYEFRYDGLSSGEQMVLLFLIRMATEQIHQSVVLVDEVELHQHPIWQSKLLHMLTQIGEGNQIIATTHSPYLRSLYSRDAVRDLGELEPHPEPVEARP